MVFRGSGHTSDDAKIHMARFTPRVTTASALAIAAIAAACVALGPARAQDNLLDRIFGGSERLSGRGDSGSAPPPAAPDRTGTIPPSAPDLIVRVDRLEAQIRQLTGVIEQLQYRNQQLESLLRRMQEDGAPRSAQPRPQALPAPSGPAATTTAPPRRGDAFDPAQNPNAPGAPHTLGALGSGQPPMGGDAAGPVGAPGGRGAGSPLDIATVSPPGGAPPPPARSANAGGAVTATLPPSQTARDEFDLAYGYVLRKDYALAEDGFRNFLSKYPGDRLAGDATYWFGESMFQRQRYRDAAEAFLNVSTKFESNAKAPDALLRLGQSLAALGEKEAACASLGEVLRKFPRASAGVKQGVEREQKRVRC
jgi:tol-pal system protein YbgF